MAPQIALYITIVTRVRAATIRRGRGTDRKQRQDYNRYSNAHQVVIAKVLHTHSPIRCSSRRRRFSTAGVIRTVARYLLKVNPMIPVQIHERDGCSDRSGWLALASEASNLCSRAEGQAKRPAGPADAKGLLD